MTLAVALGISFAALSPADAATKIVVSGTVTAKDGGGAIPGIEVCATSPAGRPYCGTSQDDGGYRITLPKGSYVLHAEDPFLYGNWVQADHRGGRRVELTASRTIPWQLDRGARITGDLRDVDRGSLRHANLSVTAVPVGGKDQEQMWSNISTDGFFEVARLPAGRYRLLVVDHSTAKPYARQWYPSGAVASAGEIVTVTTGQRVVDRDIALRSAGRLTVSTRYRGASVPATVTLVDGDGNRVDSHETRKGSVTFAGLAAGRYTVKIQTHQVDWTEWYSGQPRRSKARSITVSEGTTTTRTATLHYPTLKATRRPTLTTFGDVVRVRTHGRWNARPAKGYYGYRWYRDGKKLSASRSDADRLRLRDSDRGHRFKVCVTAHRTDHAPGTSCSRYTGKVRW